MNLKDQQYEQLKRVKRTNPTFFYYKYILMNHLNSCYVRELERAREIKTRVVKFIKTLTLKTKIYALKD